jgi:hypothetical protein
MIAILQPWRHISPPPAPMPFTRQPLVHRFWYGGMLAMIPGFGLGFLLWLTLHAGLPATWMDAADGNMDFHQLHARLQLIWFTGSFLLGFALQAGASVLGSPPPSIQLATWLLVPLWAGFLLTLTGHPVLIWSGQVLTTLAIWAGVALLVRMARHGAPERRWGIGFPLAGGIAWLGVAPWLPVEQPGWGMAMLWLGPMSTIFGAAQQLIANVLGGQRMAGRVAQGFAVLLVTGWGLTLLAAMTGKSGMWQAAGVLWLLLTVYYSAATGLVLALFRATAAGAQVVRMVIACGILIPLLAAAGMVLAGAASLDGVDARHADAILHLLALGSITPLILGIAARVASFFSGGYVVPDPWLRLLLLVWLGIMLLRVMAPLVTLPSWLITLSTLTGSVLLLVWMAGLGWRLWQIRCRGQKV